MNLNKHDRLPLVLIALFSFILLVLGWRLFYFMTDDAYIAFRYVSNSILGHGYVWNPPPFKAVEGYTSFLWVALLDVIWRIFKIEPPLIVNYISLGFSFLTILLSMRMIYKLDYPEKLRNYRIFFVALGVLGILANRTFLTWSSSGLETAMFNFFYLLWIYFVLFFTPLTNKWLFNASWAAALVYLSRPDGALMVLTTGLLGILMLFHKFESIKSSARVILNFAPLLVIPVHLLWRQFTYGEWLPNTYFAKSMPGRLWTEAGLRYSGSFIIEYGLLFYFVVLIALVLGFIFIKKIPLKRLFLLDINFIQLIRQSLVSMSEQKSQGLSLIRVGVPLLAGLLLSLLFLINGRPVLAVGLFLLSIYLLAMLGFLQLSILQFAASSTVLAQIFYYTIMIGGDHFEFRVYSNLIPLIFISFIWAVKKLTSNKFNALAALSAFLIFSLPVQWLHWNYTHNLTTRKETRYLQVSVSDQLKEQVPNLPDFAYRYIKFYDDMQSWLISHGNCMRHQEHKVFFNGVYEDVIPSRSVGENITNEGYPVIVAGTVGLTAWSLPYVNVIDYFGLNDYVIARNRVKFEEIPLAHERIPPVGYLGCFKPNLEIADRGIKIIERKEPLTAEQIITCENFFMGIYRNP